MVCLYDNECARFVKSSAGFPGEEINGMKTRWTVRNKLVGGFAMIFILSAVLAAIGAASIKTVRDNSKELTTNWLWGIETINRVKVGTQQFVNLFYQTMMTKDPAGQKPILDAMKTEIDSIGRNIESYASSVSNEEDQANYDELKKNWNLFKEQYGGSQAEEPGRQQSGTPSGDVVKTFTDMVTVLDRMIQFNHDGAVESVDKNEALYKRSVLATIIVGAVSLIAMIGLGVTLTLSITRPLNRATQALNRISAGDLAIGHIHIRRKDEFGVMLEAVNVTVEHLRQSVRQMQDAASSVAASAEQLDASSDQNSGAARQVAEAIQQVAADSERQAAVSGECERVMDEMAEGVQRIAETTSDIADLSGSAARSAREGVERIQDVSSRIRALRNTANEAGDDIRRLEEQSEQIGSISTLIGEIATQTHLLALNAAIEAARAGEHGAGFAVVAGEVRKLAAQTDESVKGIGELLRAAGSTTRQAAEAMSRSLAQADESVEAVAEAERAFERIAGSSGEVSVRIQETAAAAQQLAASSEEVAASVANMGHLASRTAEASRQVAGATEEQLASSEEIAASSRMLSATANDLQDTVRTFEI